MKILFYGAKENSWIGSMVVKKWKELFPEDELIISETRIDHSNVEKIKKEIKNCDRVFSTVGRTSGFILDIEGKKVHIPNIDYLETNLNENIRDNIYTPILLATLCLKYKKHLSYLGTGCIFSRDTRNNDYVYTEEDVPDFFGSSYSIVKGYTDSLMKQFKHCLNFRIRMPITDDWNSKNFIAKIANFTKICSYPNSMTYLPDIIPVMIDMSRNSITGTYNMVNGSVSHKEILEKYKEIVDPNHTYELIEENDLNGLLKAKRSNNILSNQTILNCYKLKDINECIVEALEKMKEKRNEVSKL
jgi:3,5-epimerase/4-reductase